MTLNRLKLYKEFIENRAYQLEQLAHFIKDMVDQTKGWASKQISNLSDEERGKFLDMWCEENGNFLVDEEFREILYYSYIVSVYSFAESSLNGICMFAKKHYAICGEKQPKIKVKEIKKYFKEVVKSDFSANSNNEWQELKALHKIRNSIVHNEGRVRHKKEKDIAFRKFLKQEMSNFILLDNHNRIQISHEYCSFIVEQVQKFLLSLIEGILVNNKAMRTDK